MYYLSRSLRDAELNYPSIECHYLVLLFATQKLGTYLISHSLNLVTKSNQLKYLLSRSTMSGRTAKWVLQLSEFDITITAPRGLGSQDLSNLLVQFPILGKEVVSVDTDEWHLTFHGSSTHRGGGAEVLLSVP